MWAVVAAFGDNLVHSAVAAAQPLGLDHTELARLHELGDCLNYNAYGQELTDLHFDPSELYRRMRPYADPLAFHAQSPEVEILRRASAQDLQQAMALRIEKIGKGAVLVTMPDEPWSRRIAGNFANALSRRHRNRIVALLLRTGDGYQVSLRAPGPGGPAMHLLAQEFGTGGGRARSAGIQFLPESDVARLMARLRRATATDA